MDCSNKIWKIERKIIKITQLQLLLTDHSWYQMEVITPKIVVPQMVCFRLNIAMFARVGVPDFPIPK